MGAQSYSGSPGVRSTGLGGRPAIDAAGERHRAGCERATGHGECVGGERILPRSQGPSATAPSRARHFCPAAHAPVPCPPKNRRQPLRPL